MTTTASSAPGVTPVLDVVVPVHNEEAVLAASIRRVDAHLAATFPYPYRITVADNASTDSTWPIATHLSEQLPAVAAVRLRQKGRGRVLKQTWLSSDATILAYLDVDLSTDLDALYPLVAPLLSGHSDLAIGSRLAHGSRVVRGAYREFVSRSYNGLLRVGLSARFTDAQCGFKAIRADVARELLPHVQDTAWFFDTELLVLAQRCGLRTAEVAVDWFDDPDSRVDVARTARDDLRGMARMRRAFVRGELPVAELAARLGRGRQRSGHLVELGQVGRFAVVGLASTLLHLGLFALLVTWGLAGQAANVAALLLSTVANTAANRRWTFDASGRSSGIFAHAQGLALLGVFWGCSSLALGMLAVLAPGAGTAVATLVVGTANLVATAAKFLLFRASMGRGDAVPSMPMPTPCTAGVTSGATASHASAAKAASATVG